MFRIRLLGLAVILGFVATLAIAQEGWVSKVDAPVSGGFGEAVVGTAEHVYIIKQLNVNETPGFFRYDPSTDSWGTRALCGLDPVLIAGDMPFRSGTALAWDNGDFLYALVGGRGDDSDRRLFLRYSISRDCWDRLADTPGSQGAGDALVWSGSDQRVYAVLGSNKLNPVVFALYMIQQQTCGRN